MFFHVNACVVVSDSNILCISKMCGILRRPFESAPPTSAVQTGAPVKYCQSLSGGRGTGAEGRLPEEQAA